MRAQAQHTSEPEPAQWLRNPECTTIYHHMLFKFEQTARRIVSKPLTINACSDPKNDRFSGNNSPKAIDQENKPSFFTAYAVIWVISS
jgi:hypothetical protein